MAWTLKAIAAALLVTATPMLAQQQATDENWEGLARVQSDKIDYVYLAPEADFRPYTKVMLDPAELAMRSKRPVSTGSSSPAMRATRRARSTRSSCRGYFQLNIRSRTCRRPGGYSSASCPGVSQ